MNRIMNGRYKNYQTEKFGYLSSTKKFRHGIAGFHA